MGSNLSLKQDSKSSITSFSSRFLFISSSFLINPSDMSKFFLCPRTTSFSLAVGNNITSFVMKIELPCIGDVVYLLDDICLPINGRNLFLLHLFLRNTILDYASLFYKFSRSSHTYIYTYIYLLTLCKAKQPLQGMDTKKETQKD